VSRSVRPAGEDTLRIGTRGSALALWQANHVRDAIQRDCGIASEIVVIQSTGDRLPDSPLESLGRGVFTKDLEIALLDGRVDIAVHSMKDVPAEGSDFCPLLALFRRADARDALISHGGETLSELRRGARIGSSSLRRASQLRALRPDLLVAEIRGNVDTRLRKVESGEYDAIILAAAGVDRLGFSARITEILSPEIMLPAASQGILCAQFFDACWDNLQFLNKLVDLETALAGNAERALLQTLQGGCSVPLGCWARFEDGRMVLDACVFSVDGGESVRKRAVAPCTNYQEAHELGKRVGQEMLGAGADRILRELGRSVG
jgi:hydroxymethylbilane synthase